MLKYKSRIVLFAVATMMASCSQDDIMDSVSYDNEVYATMPELDFGNSVENVTRSALTYDYNAKKVHFTWEEDDEIGVIPVNDNDNWRQQIPFTLTKGAGSQTGAFDSGDPDVKAISKEHDYIAFRPYTTEEDYEKLDVKYSSQVAKAFPKMKYYFPLTYDELTKKYKASNEKEYNDSEKKASAHLSKADYLVSNATVALTDGHCSFEFNRIGAVVRFYLKCPRAMKYDGLQLVVKGKDKNNNDLEFILEGMLNAKEQKIRPVKTSRAINLRFNPELDMTDTKSEYYYNGKGYIVSYMMLAPIDLQNADDISIYLKGHDGNNTYYYKSKGDLTKPNLTANMFHQWTSSDNSDDPAIIFDQIRVQDWERDVEGYSNGEEGTGTSIW